MSFFIPCCAAAVAQSAVDASAVRLTVVSFTPSASAVRHTIFSVPVHFWKRFLGFYSR